MRLTGWSMRQLWTGIYYVDIWLRVTEIGDENNQVDIHYMCLVRDCYPSPLNYYQFPKSCCTSVNEVDPVDVD